MATGLIEGALVGDAVAKLSDVITEVIKQTAKFKSNLQQLQQTVSRITPIFSEIEKFNEVLDRPERETNLFIAHLKGAEDLVRKCEKIKWNLYKRYRHSCKLQDLDEKLMRFFGFDVQLQQARDIKETLAVVKNVADRMCLGSLTSISMIPLLKGVVGFDERLQDLKAMVLKDVEDCSVVVVSAAGGCGKTTLVTMLCHDTSIKEKFRENIFFVTISSTPNLKVIVNNLLSNNRGGQQLEFQSDEDATNQFGCFLSGIKSDVLLVLDDVWSVSVIDQFKFQIPGYTILVTSRFIFTRFHTYKLEPLNDQHATTLFRLSAFSEGRNDQHTDIPDNLVDKMVKCCKKHPLDLSVVGGSLNGQHVAVWKTTLKALSEGQSVLDLNKDMLLRLKKSLDVLDENSIVKQCYLDLGLFPEDQRIPGAALMDMWVELYEHDEEGTASLTNLFELSHKNLATLMPIRSDSSTVVNYCDEQSVMQHDMLRELAIHVSSQELITQRKRLIINVSGEDLPNWIEQMPQAINARLLSISTDETFSSRWFDLQVPKVEVFVLTFMSKNYTLPEFLEKMEKLKVLIVTNYGLYPTQLVNFPAPKYLSCLTRIRLERVSISSMTKSILGLVNLRKMSLIMCELGQAFEEPTVDLPSLVEIEMDHCNDLVAYPAGLCNLVHLKKLSITNCHELCALHEGFGRLENLEVLRLKSCTKLAGLPEPIGNLHKLNILDISDCLNMNKLPLRIGELCGLRTIHMKGCTRLRELPCSVKSLCRLEVLCDEERSYLWSDFPDVKINLVEEDQLGNLRRIIADNMLF